MNPMTKLEAELALVTEKAEAAAAQLRAKHGDARTAPFGVAEDFRAEVLGELFDAIDRVQPGLGTRLQAAMYPFTPNEEQPS